MRDLEEKIKNARKRKRWMLVLAVVFLLLGTVSAVLTVIGMTFHMGSKPALATDVCVAYFDRSEHPAPTEPPTTEPPTEAEPAPPTPPDPGPYHLQTDLASVVSHHNANHDVIGWVRVSGTVINYPVMQTDNNAFYTDHNWQGGYYSGGAIFADWRCRLDRSDNSLLYGHNLANGSMFHAIKNYKSADWGYMHPYIELCSLTHRYLYRVISTNVIYGEKGVAFEYWNCIDMNRDWFNYFMTNIRSSSSVWYGYGDTISAIRNGDRSILTLQTCNSGRDDGIRCVVFAECLGDFTSIPVYDPKDDLKRQDPPTWYDKPSYPN